MRREDSLAQLPSKIIHISLQQPSPPVPAALSGTSIKAKVLNALMTVLKCRSTASCSSAQGCQDTLPIPPVYSFRLRPFKRRSSAVSPQLPCRTKRTPSADIPTMLDLCGWAMRRIVV